MTDLSRLQSAQFSITQRAIAGLLSQHARLITLETAQGSDLPESLVVERFSGREALNELFCFDIDAFSISATIDLKQFIGEEITLRLLQADGSRRAWHGYCTEASWLGADGGIARYRLRLEPFLAFLRLRRDSFIFQDKNARDIIAELLADYPQANFQFDITQPLATRPVCTQYRESDLDFLTRLLASEGLNWRFSHAQDEASAPASTAHARHQLLIFDAQARPPELAGGSTLRFHGVRATDRDDAINQFAARRRIQSNAVTLAGWDPAQLAAPAAEQSSALDAGELPALPLYDGSGERAYADTAAAMQHGNLVLQALECSNKLFSGTGTIRRLAAGHAFILSGHGHYGDGDNAFTALWVEHEGANNLNAGIAALPSTSAPANPLERGTYRNRFGCARQGVPIVPDATACQKAPTAWGAQTALVVGLENAPLTTDRDHRVKVQFAWQRGLVPNAGGLPDSGSQADAAGNAPGNHTSGTWVRVAEALAGPNWGTHFTPRIGTEVLVDFIDGDMDRPVIVAQLYNGQDLPPFAAGIDSGVNHAGVLSGLHSHSLDGAGAGYNQWLLDDSNGQLRMRLASSSAASQLNLGYLVAQSPSSAQRGSYRGTGFELRSDAWVVLRAGEGMLLSSTIRPALGCSVTSTQLDATPAVAQLDAAKNTTAKLCEAAAHQNAPASNGANKAQADFIATIDPQQAGKFNGPVHGQPAYKTKPGSKEADETQPVEKFAKPVVLLDSAASITAASAASTLLFAGQHLHWTSQADIHWAAEKTFSAVAGQTASLFTHAGGITAIAANGPLSLQAHTDQLEILADQEVTVLSASDKIEIKANRKITLQAGQSSVTLEDGNITFACPGNFTVKGGQHAFGGAGSKPAELPDLPDGQVAVVPSSPVSLLSPTPECYSQRLVVWNPVTGESMSTAYSLMQDGLMVDRGRTAGGGFSTRQVQKQEANLEALVGPSGTWTVEYHSGDDAPPLAYDDNHDTHNSELPAQ
jgi:type VI secretion system secreted protein VgrG